MRMTILTSPSGPDFLVVGAQRSGTTWLHSVLREHPELWLPPVKELHYFDRPQLRRGCLRPADWFPMALTGLKARDPWMLQFFFAQRSDDWYSRLFQKAKRSGLIAGEITPAYAKLGKDVFLRIRGLNEHIKLVFIMRDPVERAWSSIHRKLKFGRIDGELTEERALDISRSRSVVVRSSYLETIQRIEKLFLPEQLKYCFYDDLRDRLGQLVKDVVSFLGADPSIVSQMQLPSRINAAATGKPLPPRVTRQMATAYLPIVEQLCERFEGPPHVWLAHYENCLPIRR